MPSENKLICPPTIRVEKYINNAIFCYSYTTVKKKLAIETLAWSYLEEEKKHLVMDTTGLHTVHRVQKAETLHNLAQIHYLKLDKADWHVCFLC